MTPFLTALLDDVGSIRDTATTMRERSAAQLTWKPEPYIWSIADCYEHLHVVAGLMLPRMQAALETARARNQTATRPFRPRWFGRWFIHQVGPDRPRRVQAPKKFRVNIRESAPPDALDRFLTQLDEVEQLVRDCDGWNLSRARFSSPITRLLRFTLGEGLLILIRHHQRHTLQAVELTQRDNFPP